MKQVFDEKGKCIAIVDRKYEYYEPDGYVKVTLSCGHTERFWKFGLSNKEYVNRTKILKELQPHD